MTQVRYILRLDGKVLTKPESPGGVLRWLTEKEAGDAVVTYATNRAAINAAAMIAHTAEVVEQVEITNELPVQHVGEVE